MKQVPFLGFMFEPQTISTLQDGIVRAVALSYAKEGGRRTDAEDRDRARKCIDLIRIMRGDMHWSVPRIVDELPEALRTRVRGEHWEPSKTKAWAGDNAKLIVDPTSLKHALPD